MRQKEELSTVIIQTSAADKLAAITAEAGTYPVVITAVTSKKSQSEKSYNHRFTFAVSDGKYKGKEFEVVFNGAMKNAAMLGSQMMFPQSEIVRLRAAIDNCKIDEVPEGDFDLESLQGKTHGVVVDIDQVNGLYINKVTSFVPYGDGKPKSW